MAIVWWRQISLNEIVEVRAREGAFVAQDDTSTRRKHNGSWDHGDTIEHLTQTTR